MVRPASAVTVDLEDLTADIQEILHEYRIPGASIALVDRGRTIWGGGVGKADLAAWVDVTADHLFRIGSIRRASPPRPRFGQSRAGSSTFRLLSANWHRRSRSPTRGKRRIPSRPRCSREHTTGFDDLHFSEWAVVWPEISLAEGLAGHPHSRTSR